VNLHFPRTPPTVHPEQITMSNDELAQLRRVILALSRENDSLKREILMLKETNLRLIKERSKLINDNLKLSEGNVQLNEEILQHREAEMKVDQNLATLKERDIKLEQELQDLKEKMAIQEPLIKVGVAIRLRFWEQAKETRGLGMADRTIIEAGNHAAHRGDLFADAALFDLGYIATSLSSSYSLGSDLSVTRSSGTTTAPNQDSNIEDKKWFYATLYAVPLAPAKDTLLNFSAKGLEILNLSATMTSCSPSYCTNSMTGGSGPSNDDSNRFIFLAMDCGRVDRFNNPSFEFDTNPEIEDNVRELREIVNRTVRKSRLEKGR